MEYGIKNYGQAAFESCRGLKKFETNAKSLPRDLCYDCPNLSDIFIDNNCEDIGDRAFGVSPHLAGDSKKIEKVILPSNVVCGNNVFGHREVEATYVPAVNTPDDLRCYLQSLARDPKLFKYMEQAMWNVVRNGQPLIEGPGEIKGKNKNVGGEICE